MSIPNKTDLILAQLRRGGLVISERGTGKTTALVMRALEIAVAGEQVAIATPGQATAQHFERRCIELWPRSLALPIIAGDKEQFRRQRLPRDVKVLVDEYFYTWYVGVGAGAVGTPPFSIHIAGHFAGTIPADVN